MARILVGLIAGLLFGVGLVVSGMSNPQKVLNFLDVFGTWDPSLAFVLAAAVGVASIGFWVSRMQAAPLLGGRFDLPRRTDLDGRLIGGAALFGVGWGLGGFCPGPVLTAIPLGEAGALVLFAGMLAGIWLGRQGGLGKTALSSRRH